MSCPNLKRGEIWWVRLDPTEGSEIKKTRPCVILTHDTLNQLRKTVVVVPLSTAAQAHPPISIAVQAGGKAATAVIDQIRAVARHRFESKIGHMQPEALDLIAEALNRILLLK